MSDVAVVYFSGTGTTAQLADAVVAGVGPDAAVARIWGRDVVEGRYRETHALEIVDRAKAVIFGSPTYMGGPAAEFKAFADASSERWSRGAWSGKLAAGFTAGSYPNGDQGWTLAYFQVLAGQHGMLWAGLGAMPPDRLGAAGGASAWIEGDAPAPEDLATATRLGQRIAALAARL
ncbi:MAG: flavodoxin family protein [Pseudomonadota bacterium]